MKVLFAVNTENIVDSIIKVYQKQYKEIISSKNVYYYNAIIKELQRNQTYDRIIISEELEPFTNNNYDAIDKFIFEKLDNISDEAIDSEGRDIPIIVICSERREKSDDLLVKLFSMGVYNALVGQDRKIEDVCKLLNRPRTKKEAKIYYKIDQGEYEHESDNNVNEVEIQNILTHFRRIGKNEDKYIESFERLTEQYTDEQLKIIIKFLPTEVKAVLEEKSPKYQAIMISSVGKGAKSTHAKKEENTNIKVEKIMGRGAKKINGPIVIPSSIKKSEVKKHKLEESDEEKPEINRIHKPKYEEPEFEDIDEDFDEEELLEEEIKIEPEVAEDMPTKKRRGRPRKIVEETIEDKPKRGRGRPRKNANIEEIIEPLSEDEDIEEDKNEINTLSEFNDDEIEIPGFDEEDEDDEEESELPGFEDEEDEDDEEESELPGFEDEDDEDDEEESELPGFEEDDDDDEEDSELPGFENSEEDDDETEPLPIKTHKIEEAKHNTYNENLDNNLQISDGEGRKIDISHLITQDKKIVAFVGTSKNGVSFLINNIANILSSRGINTALVDLTRNKNSYYIYTENRDELREIAYNSMESLKNGQATGIQVNRNLTVFTSTPNIKNSDYSIEKMLTTLVKNYSLVLFDCDYTTNREYFRVAQEIYLIQSMDVLTIQPLTEFLRKLKINEVLDPTKLRVVINKAQRVKNLNENMIVGGMSTYNDPEMSVQDKLFDMKLISTTVIPFDLDAYQSYLSQIANCEITTKGYNRAFYNTLNRLADQVYPVIFDGKNVNKKNNYTEENTNMKFSNNMKDTLSRMKKHYK